MHYYKKNIGDYHKKAGRLSMLQHGAYMLLMDSCYDREQFPTLEEAIDWCWASNQDEIGAVKFVLAKFFTKENDVFVQQRIKDALDQYHRNSGTNKRIAIEREAKRKENSTKRSRSVKKRERLDHEAPPNQEPLTINQEPLTINQEPLKDIRAPRSCAPDWAESVIEKIWAAYPRKTNKKKSLEMLMAAIIEKPDKAFFDQMLNLINIKIQSTDKQIWIPLDHYLLGDSWADGAKKIWAKYFIDVFWNAYPKKVDRKKTVARLKAMIIKNPDKLFFDHILDCINRKALVTEKEFWPSPDRYLRDEKWTDEIIQYTGGTSGTYQQADKQTPLERINEQARNLLTGAVVPKGSIIGNGSLEQDDVAVPAQVDQHRGEHLQRGGDDTG